jgi:hypothetical protein
MDRRYQIFVSSTFLDLKDERAAIVSALLQMDAFPAGMELFPAADDDAWTLIERVIEASDYYLLVIGGKYGSLDAESEISYTEKEYDLAVALKKPVMAFLHADPDAIEFGKSEKDVTSREKLSAFRSKVKKKKHVKYWSNPGDLAGKVALSYANFRQTYPAVGWVRGDVQTSTEALTELNALRKQLEVTEQRLESARAAPPPGTDHLSQGADVVQFSISGETTARTSEDEYGHTIQVEVEAEVAWDDMFSTIGPVLLDEASQSVLKRRVDAWLTQKYGKSVRKEAREYIELQGETPTSYRRTSVTLSSDDFGTVLVQLRALGLITRSDRKRSVSDKATYWTLTPYGDEHLTTLRAISRNDQTDDSELLITAKQVTKSKRMSPSESSSMSGVGR